MYELLTCVLCVHIIVHNCRTQHSTEQFCLLSSLLSTRQEPELRCCLLERAGIILSTHADRQSVDISFTVCLFFVCCLNSCGFLRQK